MKKLMMSAFALSLLGMSAGGISAANAEAVETVTVTGHPIVAVSEDPSPVSYRQLQRERLRYYKANGTPRHGTYAEAVLRGCYWDDLSRVCVHYN